MLLSGAMIKLNIIFKRVYGLEHCVCEYYGTSLRPSPCVLHTYSNLTYFRCGACRTKYPKDGTRVCKPCGQRMFKKVFRFDGSYFYFCPLCYPPLNDLIRESEIPKHFRRGLTALKTDKGNAEALNDLLSIASDPSLIGKGSILLRGETGSGKTTLACALGMSLMRRHLIPVRHISLLRHLNLLKTLMHDYSPEGKQELSSALEVRNSRVLIIDDFNKTNYRDGIEQDTIYDFVDYRHSQRLFTVFTAQPKAFDGLTEQIASRITQMSHVYNLGSRNRRTCD